MVEHTQTIRRQFADELLEYYFVGLALKWLSKFKQITLLLLPLALEKTFLKIWPTVF